MSGARIPSRRRRLAPSPDPTSKRVAYTFCDAGDLILSPFDLLGSIGEGKGLDPIDLYTLNNGYPWKAAPVPVWEE